jgi:serine O-acetyltransferase
MKSFYKEIAKQHQDLLILPKKKLIHHFIDELFSVLFSNIRFKQYISFYL